MNDIINNSYIIGIGTRNLVLNTLGRIYIKVKDRYYEFDFRKQFGEEISIPNIIIVKNEQEVSNLTYPGDNKLIISEDGKIWITQNKKIQPIYFEINQESLTLNELTVNGQITINTTYDDNLEENPPFIINTQKLIENLNAQFLNGIEADQFAIKNNNEFITGKWNFNSFNVSNSITSSNNNMVIDFLNNKITVCDLEVTCNAKLPSNVGSNQNELGNYSGFKNRTYFGREFKFSEFNVIDVYYFDVLDFINYAYNIQYLDNYVNENSIDLDDWVNVFVSYNDEDGVELIDIENNKSIANEKLVEMGIVTKTIDDYSLLWTNLQEVNQTGYDGDIYELIIPNFEYIPFGTILPGDVVILNVSGKAAKILSISDKNVIIKLKSEEDYINDDKIHISIIDDQKDIYLLDNDAYTFNMTAIGDGTMEYVAQNIRVSDLSVVDSKTFLNVNLTEGKKMTSSIQSQNNLSEDTGIQTSKVRLLVLDDNGDAKTEVIADGNGTEIPVEDKIENPDNSGGATGDPEKNKPNLGNSGNQTKPTVKVEKITLTGISHKIAVGKKVTLQATVIPSNAADKSIVWKSSNTKYATVNSRGVVSIKKAGAGKTVTITATAGDGSRKAASYKIKCMKGIVKKVAISGQKNLSLKPGKSIKLKAKITASKGANKTLQWTSSNPKYATVTSKGKVTAKKSGKGKTVKITAMAMDGSGKKASVKIRIK